MLEYSDERHEYRYNGVIVPSVTGIISATKLVDYDRANCDELSAAALRGTIIHQCIEWYENGTLDIDSIDPELRGYFDAYLSLRKSDLPKPTATEERVYSVRYKYAGTLDQRFEDDWINDIKTGRPHWTHGLQLTAYWLAKTDNLRIKPRRLTATYLRPDGTGEVKDYKYIPCEWIPTRRFYNVKVRRNKVK